MSGAEDPLTELREDIFRFLDQRDWWTMRTPRSLALALTGEVGELASALAWMSDDEILDGEDPHRSAIVDELADVCIYLVQLADLLSVDLLAAARTKMVQNERKHPRPDRGDGSAPVR
jgi:NTP pyrophosphatase (non-canonical NTP hydrolase)